MSLWKPSGYSRLSISSIFAFARYDPLFLEAAQVLMHLLYAVCVTGLCHVVHCYLLSVVHVGQGSATWSTAISFLLCVWPGSATWSTAISFLLCVGQGSAMWSIAISFLLCEGQGSAMWSIAISFLLYMWDRALARGPCSLMHFVPFSGSEFLILLPLSHKYWNYRHLAYFFFFFFLYEETQAQRHSA